MSNLQIDCHSKAAPSHHVIWGATSDGMSGPSEIYKGRLARMLNGEIMLIANPQGDLPLGFDRFLTDEETT